MKKKESEKTRGTKNGKKKGRINLCLRRGGGGGKCSPHDDWSHTSVRRGKILAER